MAEKIGNIEGALVSARGHSVQRGTRNFNLAEKSVKEEE